MTTIVMNTLTGAVSEYDWTFQSITPTHAGNATGLYLLGGDSDGTVTVGEVTTPVPIAATIMSGKTLWGSSLKKLLEVVYLAITGSGSGQLRVNDGSYTFPVAATGQSRAKPARGLRQNYLAFGFRNLNGADFRLDRIEVPIGESKTRRV